MKKKLTPTESQGYHFTIYTSLNNKKPKEEVRVKYDEAELEIPEDLVERYNLDSYESALLTFNKRGKFFVKFMNKCRLEDITRTEEKSINIKMGEALTGPINHEASGEEELESCYDQQNNTLVVCKKFS